MLYRLSVLPFILSLGLAMSSHAQKKAIRYHDPVFSSSVLVGATGERGVTRALVVGTGSYQNEGIGTLPFARRDAEAFAAFLKTPAGGSVTWENLNLLTNKEATLANVANVLDMMVTESRQGDKIIVFISTIGQIRERSDPVLLFYDSPPAPTGAGFIALSRLTALLGKAASQKGARVFLAIEITPTLADIKTLERWNTSESRYGLFSEKMAAVPAGKTDSLASTCSFGNTLMRGLLGLADADQNEKLFVPELLSFLHTPDKKQDWAGRCAYLAFSDKSDWLCKAASGYSREKLETQAGSTQTPILQLEVQPLDGFMAGLNDPAAHRMYEDFILTIRLGQLLTPPERCAAILLDSLLRMERLAPVHKQLQRRMAVAYQDEAQQAINAYLQTRSHEMARRRKEHDHYKLYPRYLQLTSELLGEGHFMRPMLDVKRLYFEALAMRLDAEHRRADSIYLPLAMKRLEQAVAIEPDAAFLYNEMGVIHAFSGHYSEAEAHFLLALERSPTWSLPQANLSIALQQQNRFAEAREASISAIALNPSNPDGYVKLGLVFQRMHLLDSAAIQYRRALRIDPEYMDAHYNMACVQALSEQPDAALESLRAAIKYGFDQPLHILEDEDLRPLHGTRAFAELMAGAFPAFRR